MSIKKFENWHNSNNPAEQGSQAAKEEDSLRDKQRIVMASKITRRHINEAFIETLEENGIDPEEFLTHGIPLDVTRIEKIENELAEIFIDQIKRR